MEDKNKYIPVKWIKEKILKASARGELEYMIKEQVLLELLLEWSEECRVDD